MDLFQGNIHSKLPQTGTSIFAVMTGMAKEYNALTCRRVFLIFLFLEN